MTTYVKYGRTAHLVWSPGVSSDDVVLDTVSHFEGKEVVATEKMDGECLNGSTKITMADYSQLPIRDIVKKNMVGTYVLGQDKYGNIVPSRILKTFNNGRTY